MFFINLLHWLNETSFSIYLRESELAFPLTEAIHLIGLGISMGAIMWVDLRLLGLAMRREKVSDVVGRLEPFAIGGFVVMFVSGILLFVGKPDNYFSTWAFRIKMLLLPLAGLNVLYFHKSVYPHVREWDTSEILPGSAKMVGLVSATLWVIIAVLGRWTAYFADDLAKR